MTNENIKLGMRKSLFNLYQLLDIVYPIYSNGIIYAILQNIDIYYNNILVACKYLNGAVTLQDIKEMSIIKIDKFLQSTCKLMQEEINNKNKK